MTPKIKKIEALCKTHPEVKELWEEYQKFFTDPAAMLYFELSELTRVLVKDIKEIREEGNTILSGNKDDKKFERIMMIYKQSEGIFSALELGKKSVNPEMMAPKNDTEEMILK